MAASCSRLSAFSPSLEILDPITDSFRVLASPQRLRNFPSLFPPTEQSAQPDRAFQLPAVSRILLLLADHVRHGEEVVVRSQKV